MKLVDTAAVLGRVNSALLIIEESNEPPEQVLNDVKLALMELKAGLDFHLESFPKTIAPGITKPRKSSRRRRKRK